MGKADKLITKISECQRELDKIQKGCIHKEKEIKFINLGQGLRWVCKDCKALIGWPTKSDLTRWSK